MKRFVAFLAAAGMAVSPLAATAQDASALSLARASVPATSGLNFFQDEDEHGGGSTAVALGVVLVILIGIAAISGNGSEPSNSP
jgi:hypothetical protein